MNKIRKLQITAALTLLLTSLHAETTMCFKENVASPSSVESIALDGGKCDSKRSIKDMKSEGWVVEDIKISAGKTGMNFMYVLKKGQGLTASANADDISEEIYRKVEARIEAKNKRIKEEKEKKAKQDMMADGKKLYISKCQTCHGEKAEQVAYNTSRPLNTLSLKDMELAIRGYTNSTYDRGMALVMLPMANTLVPDDLKAIHTYIQTIK